VEIRLIEDRIKELCEKATSVNDADVPALFAELKALLTEHSEAARFVAAKTLNRLEKESPQLKKGA